MGQLVPLCFDVVILETPMPKREGKLIFTDWSFYDEESETLYRAKELKCLPDQCTIRADEQHVRLPEETFKALMALLDEEGRAVHLMFNSDGELRDVSVTPKYALIYSGSVFGTEGCDLLVISPKNGKPVVAKGRETEMQHSWRLRFSGEEVAATVSPP